MISVIFSFQLTICGRIQTLKNEASQIEKTLKLRLTARELLQWPEMRRSLFLGQCLSR